MQRLRSLSGPAFDRAFLEHERAFHAAVLSALNSTLIPSIQNKELKDFVVSLVPAFDNKPIQRDAIYWEHEGNAAIRAGDWKLVRLGRNGPIRSFADGHPPADEPHDSEH